MWATIDDRLLARFRAAAGPRRRRGAGPRGDITPTAAAAEALLDG